jgi:hypothetical protein
MAIWPSTITSPLFQPLLGQFTQRGWLANYGGPGSTITIFMYNTGFGAS